MGSFLLPHPCRSLLSHTNIAQLPLNQLFKMAKIRPLSEELQQVAKTELNEVPEKIEEDLKALEEWILKTPHLKSRTDDKFLIVFLRGCKFDLEKAKRKLDAFYTVRAQAPEIFSNRKVTHDILQMARTGCVLTLPNTEGPAGPRFALLRPGLLSNLKESLLDYLKIVGMGQDMYMFEDDNTLIAGYVIIIDLNDTTIDSFAQMTLPVIKHLIAAWFHGNPVRFKAFYVVNKKPFVMNLINLMMSFLSDKIRSRVHILDTMESMFTKLPQALFPAEYGGEAGTTKDLGDDLATRFENYKEFFEDEVNYGVDESQRTEKSNYVENLFGIDGSFRQLKID